MMRRQIPLLIIFVSGFVMIIDYFFPAVPHIRGYRQIFLNWGRVAVTFAMLLGMVARSENLQTEVWSPRREPPGEKSGNR